jgi:hypothetical protein|tara:strand:- start:56 stop:325 length:270 start_codon:yes stop_codon:yes gene_type:complete
MTSRAVRNTMYSIGHLINEAFSDLLFLDATYNALKGNYQVASCEVGLALYLDFSRRADQKKLEWMNQVDDNWEMLNKPKILYLKSYHSQ